MDDEDPKVKYNAIEALGWITQRGIPERLEKYVDEIADFLTVEDSGMRSITAEALGVAFRLY